MLILIKKDLKSNIQVANSYSVRKLNFNIQVAKSCQRQLGSKLRIAPREKEEVRILKPIL